MKSRQTKKNVFTIMAALLLPLFLSVSAVNAQTMTDLADISITMIPLNPAAGQVVTLRAQSFAVDLTQANLSWNYGGKVVGSGQGKTEIAVTAPAAGTTATATVTVSGFGQSSMSASILLNPASVDMLWEAVDSYTPPFYKGKAALSIGGAFRVSAIPTASAPRQVTYSWTRNGSALQAASGLNRSSVVLDNTIFNKQEGIAVNVYGGTFQGNGNVSVGVGTPAVIAYQKKGGFTDYAHGSTSTIMITGPGTTLRFEPFYFSIPDTITGSLAVAMQVDAQSVIGDPVLNELRISRPETTGTHSLLFSANTVQYSVQNVKRTFNLLFD